MNRPTSPLLLAAPVAGLALLLLAGCGGSSGSATTAAPASSSAAGSGSAGPGARAGGFGGLAGSVASVGSGSFTLTAAGGTATVDWTASTTFDRTAPAGLAQVRAGSCVAVTETSSSDASTGSVDATAVRISAPGSDGTCGAGGFGGFGGRAGAPPSGASAGGAAAPSGRARAGAFRALAGKVDSVSGNAFVVDVTTPGSGGAGSSTTTTTVDVSSTTTYTATTPATASDLAVGECARVTDGTRPAGAPGRGTAAPSAPATPTGPVTARSVTLSAPVGGSCPTPTAGRGAGTAGGSGATA